MKDEVTFINFDQKSVKGFRDEEDFPYGLCFGDTSFTVCHTFNAFTIYEQLVLVCFLRKMPTLANT